ncbi:MAG: L,D-transpeptidase family protein [Patescibacteria group bacterium]|nr:L,D-transpeptidase family protein [Patescibacteria group bacterium]MDE1965924.1 L,D-transpeptidase family protein [Patescibacteria group bacterium]
MYMSGLGHSFDWKGFRFAMKLLLACAVAVLFGRAALSYAVALHTPAPALVVVRETAASPSGPALPLATTTPERIIGSLTIADAVPQTGKFVAADLQDMTLALYQDGAEVAEYPILTKGKPGSPYETPSGFYSVLAKQADHFNKQEQVHMPYSMQFYGNYFIHGWPYYTDGSPVNPDYSGGCIRLSTDDARKVYAFADTGTGIFVYDPSVAASSTPLVLAAVPAPDVTAASYLVADVDTGDVYLDRNAEEPRPIASLTKLMTALVANETIMFNNPVTVTKGEMLHEAASADRTQETFVVGDLLYPLLMESNNAIADRLAAQYGTANFVSWMNATAKSLGMQSTHYADPSGVSSGNVSTPDDLFRLATYLADKKSFIWNITRTPSKTLYADSGDVFRINNFNIFSGSSDFIGGKVGKTGAAGDTMTSVFSVPVNGVTRRVAIIVLKSEDYGADTTKLADWFEQSAKKGAALLGTACTSCAAESGYRKIPE